MRSAPARGILGVVVVVAACSTGEDAASTRGDSGDPAASPATVVTGEGPAIRAQAAALFEVVPAVAPALADNPLTVDPMKIKDIRVWGTVHEGRVLPIKRGSASQATGAGGSSQDVTAGTDGELSLVLAARLAELAGHRHGEAHEPH